MSGMSSSERTMGSQETDANEPAVANRAFELDTLNAFSPGSMPSSQLQSPSHQASSGQLSKQQLTEILQQFEEVSFHNFYFAAISELY
mmetsp:Transcript_10827/g.22241  ORF Transcript_10827/g.22241 Transcript_10827/m.22241 type:complete len:88 (-) Transcript_10827:1484-1747(-)